MGSGVVKQAALSSREGEVLQQLRAGKPYKEIASRLGIAESTARVHGSNALRKIKRTRLALVVSDCVGAA